MAPAPAALLSFPFRLETERLVVASPRAQDVDDLHATLCESMEDLGPWIPWADHVPTREETVARIDRYEQCFREGSDMPMHVWRRSDGRLVGGVGVHRPRPAIPAGEVGYWVRSSDGGRGYVSEAVSALVDHLFDQCALERVELRIDPENVPSRALAERLGFVLEGILRANDRHWDGSLKDSCVYARIASDAPR